MAKHTILALLTVVCGCAAEPLDDDSAEDLSLEVSEEDEALDAEFETTIDGKADGALGYNAVAQLVVDAGVPCTGERIATAVAVARAESSFRPRITNTVGNAHGIDRGLWQINSYWHPEVSATCALSASCNARAMARISRNATRWTEWWTWKNNRHVQYMASARAAQRHVCGND